MYVKCKRGTKTEQANRPGGLRWSYDGCEHLFGLPRRSNGPLVLAPVLRGGWLRQAQREGGAFAGWQHGEFPGVDGWGRGLGQRHLGAALLALVFHHDALQRGQMLGADAGQVLKQRRRAVQTRWFLLIPGGSDRPT